jgi:general secretion pathway protein M
MRAWFERLQPRERWIVLIGGVAAVVIVLWGLIYKPLSDGSERLRESVAMKQRLLVDLARAAGTGPVGAQNGGASSGQTLVVLVDTTAREHGLTFPRMRPDGANGIAVTFSNAPFDDLLEWLITLQTTHSVSVESASFTSARQRGLVNGQLFLRRT